MKYLLAVLVMLTACKLDKLLSSGYTIPQGESNRLSVCLPPDTVVVVLYGTDTTRMIFQRCW
jgi:hypothetical protein